MDQAYYDGLPKKISKRAEQYLVLAKDMAKRAYGPAANEEIPLISVQIAAAMMNLEAAEIMASEQERIAQKLEETT